MAGQIANEHFKDALLGTDLFDLQNVADDELFSSEFDEVGLQDRLQVRLMNNNQRQQKHIESNEASIQDTNIQNATCSSIGNIQNTSYDL